MSPLSSLQPVPITVNQVPGVKTKELNTKLNIEIVVLFNNESEFYH